MKASRVVLLSAVAGSMLGIGLAWANLHNAPRFQFQDLESPLTDRSDAAAEVLVDSLFHNFGEVGRDKRISHAFRFTNRGKAPLLLEAGSTTCALCTIARLDKPRVEPGETVEVIVEYRTSGDKPEFRQTASILTNDPRRPKVDLDIFGEIVSDYDLRPNVGEFAKVAMTETKSVDFTLTAGILGKVRIVRHLFEDPSSDQFFEVKSEPMPADELKSLDVEDGYRITVTVKPGLPLGPFRKTIRFELAVEGREEHANVDVLVRGVVDGDISIVGQGWDEDRRRLQINRVKSAQGAVKKLFLLVRGSERHNVEFKLARAEPSWLQVSIGEPEDLQNNAEGGTSSVVKIPLTIEIPPGTPPANYSGVEYGKFAEIVLETTHPQAKEVPLRVQFVVER